MAIIVLDVIQDKLAGLYDKNITDGATKNFKNIIVNMAMASFLLHILLVYIIYNTPFLPRLTHLLPHNYLAAIYTPFSFIIIYEIFELVIAIPRSITHFISKQFEIISLIFLREVFKDLTHLSDLTLTEANQQVFFKEIMVDMGTAIGLFFLLVVFNHVNTFRFRYSNTCEVRSYINVKKSLAFILGVSVIGLSIWSMFDWAITGYNVISSGGDYYQPLKLVFFKDFFTILVFVDIFLLIFALIYTNAYDVIFRNGAFVISTILIRLSITSPRPLNIYVALMAVALGIITSAIFVYYHKVHQGQNRDLLEACD